MFLVLIPITISWLCFLITLGFCYLYEEPIAKFYEEKIKYGRI